MCEADEMEAARDAIAAGAKEEALPVLWKLFVSKNCGMRLDAGLLLLVALDPLTQNEQLLRVTDATIELASTMRKDDVRAYLLGKKAEFLYRKLSDLTYQQRNLNLAAGIFQWIGFSLEADKVEFAAIAAERSKLKKDIGSLEAGALVAIHGSEDHYLRGHLFMSLGEISFSRFMDDQLEFCTGGKLKSKIMNIYFVRRWHLNQLIGFTRGSRSKLREAQSNSVGYFLKAIEEFAAGDYKSDLAHALFALAAKFTFTYRFRKARKYLNRARQLAEAEGAKHLFIAISEIQKRIDDKYRHPRNYVEEFGLDLPRALRGHR
jgi:hypothetical protein